MSGSKFFSTDNNPNAHEEARDHLRKVHGRIVETFNGPRFVGYTVYNDKEVDPSDDIQPVVTETFADEPSDPAVDDVISDNVEPTPSPEKRPVKKAPVKRAAAKKAPAKKK